jgi:PAS domain S-box-containing protein
MVWTRIVRGGWELADFDGRMAFNVLPDAAVVADSAQHILFANQAVKRLLGWESVDLEGRTLSELIPPPHELMELDQPLRVRAARNDGALQEVEMTLSGDCDDLLVATLRPVNDLAGSQDSVQKLQAILNTISVGVLLAEGPEGRLTLVNPAADQIAGEPVRAASYAEFVAKFPLEKLDGRPMDFSERPLARTIKSGSPVREILKYRRKDDKEVILEVTTAPFPGPRGGAVTTFLDVTERVHLEQELATSASQLRSLIDHLPLGVAYFNKMAVCRAANPPARRFLRRPKDEIIGVPADELFSESPELRDALNHCVNDQSSQTCRSLAWPDNPRTGAVRFLDWQFEPLNSEPGKTRGALAIITDVTERTHAEVEKQRDVKAIEDASHRKTQFLSAVSHDLRTPVNALSLQAELLSRILETHENPGDELQLLAGDIKAASNNLIELINDLLDLTRFDSGVIDFRPSDFALDEWLAATLAPLELTARTRGLEFSWRTDRLGRILHSDRVKLGRVLTNLVGNAVKFTERGEVAIKVDADPQGRLRMRVRDTGPGIPADQLDRIFDEFAQLRNPERDRTKGTGLGLAICRRLVEGVGGQLFVESEPGRGSKFTALYPASHLRSDAVDPISAHYVVFPPSLETSDSSPSILLVEHDAQIRNALQKILVHEGYAVKTAANEKEVFQRIQEFTPSMILLDFMMPGVDGREMLESLREEPTLESTKIIAITGDLMNAETAEIQSIDSDGILAKPIDVETLRNLLAAVLPLDPDSSE